MRTPGIGHNKGPEAGRSWRTHCWRKARAELIGARLPVEVVRRRVARAKVLGLAYPDYASILLGSGRDIVGFLFTCEAMGLRLARRLEMPESVRTKLAALERCGRLSDVPEGEAASAFQAELSEVAGVPFDACGRLPDPDRGWGDARRRLRAWIAPTGLHPKGIVLVGTQAGEARLADAADLARFLPHDRYFAQGTGAGRPA